MYDQSRIQWIFSNVISPFRYWLEDLDSGTGDDGMKVAVMILSLVFCWEMYAAVFYCSQS